jgi:hypothetical protein
MCAGTPSRMLFSRSGPNQPTSRQEPGRRTVQERGCYVSAWHSGFTGCLVSLVALALAGVFTSRALPEVSAQAASPVVGSAHPIVGAWWWENISDDPFDDSYAVFGDDGTYVEETTYIGAGIGSWQATDARTADLLIVYQDIEGGLDPNRPDAFVPGTVTMWLSLEVAADGNHLTASGPVEIRDVDGKLVNQFVFNGTATRLIVGRDQPSATPAP